MIDKLIARMDKKTKKQNTNDTNDEYQYERADITTDRSDMKSTEESQMTPSILASELAESSKVKKRLQLWD